MHRSVPTPRQPASWSTEPGGIAVVGLGFVGLQVAATFGRVFPTTGYDIDGSRVAELRKGFDRHGEVEPEALASERLNFTDDPGGLDACDAFIVAVPTPVDDAKRPDLRYLVAASREVGAALARRAARRGSARTPLVVYESSVYPGCTEEVCGPVLEEVSGLAAGKGFLLAYSPERINPGDPEHRFDSIIKVVAAQDPEGLEAVASLYAKVVRPGVYRAPDIRTAEAAKVIENTQRDLNIALMNELSLVFHRMGLDTGEVLRAAGTKWNFLRFHPGLVGGHCIPVDPYYLTHKAEELGYFPEVILAGRRINDGMGRYVAQEALKLLLRRRPPEGARALVLGVAFKEDVPDARNTRVVDLIRELEAFGLETDADDPLLGAPALRRMGLRVPRTPPFADAEGSYDLVVLAVPHAPYRVRTPAAYVGLLRDPRRAVIADLKSALPRAAFERAGVATWSL